MPVFTVSNGGVPIGNYAAAFAGVETTQANAEKGFGPGIRFKFTIEAGLYAGQTASRVTGSAASIKNALGKMLSGLIGRALKEGEQIDPDQYIGRKYLIVVAAGQNGGTRVEAIVPAPAA
jgi:hypothetical protein